MVAKRHAVDTSATTPEDLHKFLEEWMTTIGTRDIWRHTENVDLLWAAGSSINLKLVIDPYLHVMMNSLVAVDPTGNPSKVALREGILMSHAKMPCLFHRGTAFNCAGLIADRIRRVCSKYRFMAGDAGRLRQTMQRADGNQKRIIEAVVCKLNIGHHPDTPVKKCGPPGDPIDELEAFLSDVSPPADKGPAPGPRATSTALVHVGPVSPKPVRCIDLTENDGTLEGELRELAEFADGASGDGSGTAIVPISGAESANLPAPIADLAADLLLMDSPDIRSGGISRALPKPSKAKTGAAAKGKTAKKSPSPPQSPNSSREGFLNVRCTRS